MPKGLQATKDALKALWIAQHRMPRASATRLQREYIAKVRAALDVLETAINEREEANGTK